MHERYKRDFIRAGALAGEVRSYGKSLICPGASYNEVILKIREKILQLGAIPAFPPQIALNEVAAHFLPPPDEDIIFSNELVKLDVGVCYNGAIGDCAVTVDLSGNYQLLIDAAEAALLAAEKLIEVERPIREIGAVIERTISSFGLSPVRNLSGHGLGHFKVHTPPNIPNCDDGSNFRVKKGMTFAIEPFATDGNGLIYEEEGAAIFSLTSPPSVYMKHTSPLLPKIKTFQRLPFAIHDLMSENIPLQEVRYLLQDLVDKGVIAAYGPLIEEKKGFVAQAENSILVDERGNVLVTTR